MSRFHQFFISILSINALGSIGCSSSEPKNCICEVVAPQPSCENLTPPNAEQQSPVEKEASVQALPATSTNQDEVESNQQQPEGPTPNVQLDDAALAEKPIIEEQELNDSAKRSFVVVSNGLNVRSGPSMEAPVVGMLKQGAEVNMVDREGIWVMIGPEQYVSIRHLRDR
jgi:hypothetical protein